MKIVENFQKLDVPSYSKRQEDLNFYSHLLGIPLGIIVIALSIMMFVINKIDVTSLVGLIIYGLTIILLYSMSASYHYYTKDITLKRVKRVIDHCTIYLLIAGTYTPICIYVNKTNSIGFIVLIIEWSLAFLGVIMNAINLQSKIVKALSMVLYISLGWMIMFSTMFTYIPTTPFTLILIGGIAYTIGSILYGIGHKNLWFHGVFHIFCLIGTIMQGIGVFALF